MKLLVDSGSTKADWIAINNSGDAIFSSSTLGLNPEILNEDEIINRLNNSIEIAESKDKTTHLYFYGAGCGTDRMKNHLKQIFQKYFTNAYIEVYEDTYAAVYGTCKIGEKAIVSILGTGSNCSYFDGESLIQKVQSLGYIAMDDCSGNRFGRHMLRAYYFNKMPLELAEEFGQTYDMDADVVKQNLYKEPNPNAYLASFAGFLIKYKETSFCKTYIEKEIETFVENYIKQFDDYQEVPCHFIGSIAYYLQEDLERILSKHNILLGKVYQKPMDGLVEFHKN
ncbi:MAG: hypothetical protein QM535_22225 [Limnohabitans sp.]|nr:hypothetical protein [Limnohabitans sp.]